MPIKQALSLLRLRAHYSNFSLLILMTFASLALSLGCADELVVGTTDPVETNSECPAQFFNNETGVCLINDVEEYNSLMEENGEVTEEELLNIDNSDLIGDQKTRLAQEGQGKFFIYVNETKRIGIRVVNYVGVPVPGHMVSFQFSTDGTSDPLGSTLSSMNAISDQFGVASVEVTGGSIPTYFRLIMETEEGDELSYGISVIQQNAALASNPEELPPGQRCNLYDIQGTYDIENSYELGRLLGDGVFNTLQTINRALTDPGGLIGDWIRDRIGGFIGDAVRGIVRTVVNSLLQDLDTPGWVNKVTNIIADVTELLTDLQIKSNIRLGGASGPDCDVEGIHTWEELVVVWRGDNCSGIIGNNNNNNNNQDPNCGESRINLSEVGVSASESEFTANVENQNALSLDLVINEHQLDLNVGVVLITLLQTVILPRRASVRSIGELVADIMPCDQFGDFASNLVGNLPIIGGRVRSFARDACRDGVEALGNDLTRQLISNIEVSTFKVQGRCKMRSTDTDPKTEEMYEGRWEEGQGTFLQGSFEGTLRE